MKVTLATAVALVLLGVPAAAQRAKSPADAAVFIRLSGSVHAETIDEVGFKRTVDLDHVEIGSGSGFVISPFGYVLTNDHVVNSTDQFLVTKGLQQARVTLKVSRVDVCFRPEVVAARALSSPCVEASVTASDPALDLAVLFVSGSNLPYIALGDSDVVTSGLAVDALGYPFGREVEVALEETHEPRGETGRLPQPLDAGEQRIADLPDDRYHPRVDVGAHRGHREALRMPGDDIEPHAEYVTTRATTIRARCAADRSTSSDLVMT